MATQTYQKDKFNRRFVSLKLKLEILDRLESGESILSVAKQLGRNESTIRAIKNNESKIRAMALIAKGHNLLAKTEKCLFLWIEDCNKKNIPVHVNFIKQKAQQIYGHLRTIGNDPSSSDEPNKFNFEWFTAFKSRFPLHNLNIHGGEFVDQKGAKRFKEELSAIIKYGEYTADQVFNADDTMLFWNKLTNQKYCSDFNKNRNRITVLLCSNASGDYITKSMLINRSLKPQGMRETELSIYWWPSEKAWITTDIFRHWFFNSFAPDVERYLAGKNIPFKVLLLIDNVPGRPTDLRHPNIKVIFLPPNTATVLQPLNQGITHVFKSYYIRRSLEFILEQKERDSTKAVEQLWNNFTVMTCIEIIVLSIDELESSTLNACWRNIWPEAVSKGNGLDPITIDMKRIINAAQSLNLDGYCDMREEDVHQLFIDNKELDIEQLVNLAHESGNFTLDLFK